LKRPLNYYRSGNHALKGVANCRETRSGEADAFEGTFGATATATAEHVSATAETFSRLLRMNVSVRRAPLLPEEGWRRFADGVEGGIVHNVSSANPGKLAAWISASHVEKPPKKKETPTP
jgi:hypothetical protein